MTMNSIFTLPSISSESNSVTEPPSLTIKSSSFTNIYFMMNSLIILQNSGLVSITSSQFSGISTCGGLVSNLQIYRASSYLSVYEMNTYYDRRTINQTTPEFCLNSNSWFGLNFNSNHVSDYYKFVPVESVGYFASKNANLMYNLFFITSVYGDVSIIGNKFQNIQRPLKMEYYSSNYGHNNPEILLTIPQQSLVINDEFFYQIKFESQYCSLLRLIVTGALIINNNRFENISWESNWLYITKQRSSNLNMVQRSEIQNNVFSLIYQSQLKSYHINFSKFNSCIIQCRLSFVYF